MDRFENMRARQGYSESTVELLIAPQQATVTRGEKQAFTVNGDADWSISGNVSSNTRISNAGVLTVDEDEKAQIITVIATAGNVSAYALVKLQTVYTVTFDANGGTFDDGTTIMTKIFPKREIIELSDFPNVTGQEGDTLKGWYSADGKLFEEKQKILTDVTYTAKWFNPDQINFVEYIESTGTQYIDTGICPANDFYCKVVASFGNESDYVLCGVYYPSDRRFAFGSYNNNLIMNSISNATAVQFPNDRDYHTFIIDNQKGTRSIDSQSATSSVLNCPKPFFLFKRNSWYSNSEQQIDCGGNIKLKSCEIYNNGAWVLKLKPCKDENGVYCLYDEISESFLYNNGTGRFLGSDRALPENTKLLMNFDNNFVDLAEGNTTTMYGTEQYQAGKFDDAIYLDGSSCVRFPLTSELTLGENDFTIAGWFMCKNVSKNGCLFTFVHYASSSYQWQGVAIWLSQGGNLRFCCDISNNNKNRFDSTTYMVNNTWYHLALVRHNGVVTLYVNGKSIGSLNAQGTVYQYSSAVWRIGATNNRTSSATSTNQNQEYFTGLVDEFIIVNGTALWTEEFTPPEEPYLK